MVIETDAAAVDFDEFVGTSGVVLRRALVAFYGVEIGTEASSEALAVAWGDWSRVTAMANPVGYLFRVGQSRARSHVRWARRRVTFPVHESSAVVSHADELVDLAAGLARLNVRERTAVVLVKAYGYSHREVAALLSVTDSTVNNLVHRGLKRLRDVLEERR